MKGDTIGGPIRWRMHLAISRERVFAALDSDDGRASFWAKSAQASDGRIEFRFSNGFRYTSAVLEREPPGIFALDYIGGPVRFELTSDGAGGTNLLVTQHGIGSAEWNEVHAGWLNVLFPLKAWLVHGVDLRNHDATRSWDEGYVDA